MINAKLSFTFESVIEGSESRGHYSKYEKGIPVFNGNKLLILDDILGVGSVLHKIISLIKSCENPPNLIHTFCIYSLGEKNIPIESIDDNTVEYLISFPDVQYWKADTNDRCKKCIETSVPSRREE